MLIFASLALKTSQAQAEASDSAYLIQNSIGERINDVFIGDLAEIRKRRILRVLVSYNRTNFFTPLKANAA